MVADSSIRHLSQLARLYGVQTSYYDVAHSRKQAPAESLLAILRALGAPVESLADIHSALREKIQALRQRMLEPVNVVWDGESPVIKVQLPKTLSNATLVGYLEIETGEQKFWRWSGSNLATLQDVEIEGISYVLKEIPLPEKLPLGYHRFILEISGKSVETLIIAAPRKSYMPPTLQENRLWGVFLPLYALSTRKNWGSGEFSDLETLTQWVASIGGNVIATLPLLPTFLEEPFEPSPYNPVSRLLWNEFYLDVTRSPELARCPSAQSLLESIPFQKEIEALRRSALVDYCRLMALKRRILSELCRCFFAESSERLQDFYRFIQSYPIVEDYACFRAASEKQRVPWRLWPEPLRHGVLKGGDYDEAVKRYYLYAQWLAHEQVQSICEKSRKNNTMLYLDLPVGVHPDGYDVWRERNAFGLEASAGAPPDAVFTRGQNWRFPPLHPERIREQGYRYTIAYMRHHLQHAGILRIDHVMGFHRLFWIPKGLEAGQGIYVRYRAEEFYAILSLESHRSKTIVVGEDLGTVPPYVRPAMSRHGLHRLYVLQYELACNPQKPVGRIPSNSIISLNTHDMPPFAAFWKALDIEEREPLGLLDMKNARAEQRSRRRFEKALIAFLQSKGWLKKGVQDIFAITKACLAFLSASRAHVVLVNLEDLWRETQPQNIPGTEKEYPNWQRKARYSLEEFCQMPEVRDALREIDALRKR